MTEPRSERPRLRASKGAGGDDHRTAIITTVITAVAVVVAAAVSGLFSSSDGGSEPPPPAVPPPPVVVPDVIETPLKDARARLTGAGLSLGPVTRKCSQRGRDVVADQRPDAGTEASRGTQVRLTVLVGPPSHISSPKSNQTVRRPTFSVYGTACVIAAANQLWLAIDTQGGLSPKLPPLQLSADGKFDSSITEPSRIKGGMSVVLLLVKPSGQRRIKRWIADGKRTGRYPPLTRIVGSTTLDSVRVR